MVDLYFREPASKIQNIENNTSVLLSIIPSIIEHKNRCSFSIVTLY